MGLFDYSAYFIGNEGRQGRGRWNTSVLCIEKPTTETNQDPFRILPRFPRNDTEARSLQQTPFCALDCEEPGYNMTSLPVLQNHFRFLIL